MAEDIVDESVDDWVTATTPRERVHSIAERSYDPVSADEVADRAETTPKTARKHLEELAQEGFLTRTAQPDRQATLYRRSPTSLVTEEAAQINRAVSQSELTERIAAMERDLRSYRETAGADSPADAVLQDEQLDEQLLYEWRSTRRNLRFAKAALAISQAEETVDRSFAQ